MPKCLKSMAFIVRCNLGQNLSPQEFEAPSSYDSRPRVSLIGVALVLLGLFLVIAQARVLSRYEPVFLNGLDESLLFAFVE